MTLQDSFLVSGIMCSGSCGTAIRESLNGYIEECKQRGQLPKQARLILDAEPQTLGLHRISITIESDELEYNVFEKKSLFDKFKAVIQAENFEIVDGITPSKAAKNVNWINILINLIAMAGIVALSIIFPPSIFLTIGLSTLSIITTAFTARHYLFNFFRNKSFFNMSTTITLGWLLSSAHTLYHSIIMGIISSFSMIFMSFIMPIILIAVINGMDEIKRQILNKSKKMHLQGIKNLFPQMAEDYLCYQFSQQEAEKLSQGIIEARKDNQWVEFIQNLIEQPTLRVQKNRLTKGMLIEIKSGECFPVDCILIQEQATVDASLLTGEPQQIKHRFDRIPAGAINLGAPVVAYATADSYNSTVNALLFRANRMQESPVRYVDRRFHYLYTALIILSMIAAIAVPFVLGIFTVPLLLQNITGILFAICPCTMAIAYQLPDLLTIHQRSKRGIILRNEFLCEQSNEIHTVVFDKTGTLTTGQSQVESHEGISAALWRRIYLLENTYGAGHPLAIAINRYYEANNVEQSLFSDMRDVVVDPKRRGLMGVVQGKQIHIGNADYLRQTGIAMPVPNQHKMSQGFSAVYVAEDNVYKGVIYIKHEIRPDILGALAELKNQGKKIIMLTGDNRISAEGFNHQNGSMFNVDDIHADQTPAQKENFLDNLMRQAHINPKGIWFVGDGLNDAPCARMVSEKGGVSCAMTMSDKAAFFTDISLNGGLNYLFKHTKLNQFYKKNKLQNQGLLIFGALASLAFLVSFSVVGLTVSPMIPLIMMASTTLMVLFNSYRVPLAVDNALDKNQSVVKQLFASDLSLALLVGASFLLMTSLLLTTVMTGGLALPAIIFTAGAVSCISSACALVGTVMLGLFSMLGMGYLFVDRCVSKPVISPKIKTPLGAGISSEKNPRLYGEESYGELFRRENNREQNHLEIASTDTLSVR